MALEEVPAAWYPDPDDDGASQRYWDGNDWTERTRSANKPRPTPGPRTSTAVVRAVAAPQPAPATVTTTPKRTVQVEPVPPVAVRRQRQRVRPFYFDGGAGTYVGTGILAVLVTVLTLGICTPFALVLKQRWRAKHTYINGHRLLFTGSALGLFGQFIKWWLLIIVTVGVYSFWVVPRLTKWVVENTEFDPAFQVSH